MIRLYAILQKILVLSLKLTSPALTQRKNSLKSIRYVIELRDRFVTQDMYGQLFGRYVGIINYNGYTYILKSGQMITRITKCSYPIIFS